MGIFSQQQSEESNQPLLYPEPPKMLTTKDMSYMQDMMSWCLLANKTMRHSAEHCQIQDLKTEYENAADMHMKHYNTLLKFLGSSGGQQQ